MNDTLIFLLYTVIEDELVSEYYLQNKLTAFKLHQIVCNHKNLIDGLKSTFVTLTTNKQTYNMKKE